MDNSTPTIGASYLQHRVTQDGVDLSLQIWDTAGQERFRSMAPMYYRSAKAAVLVFDTTREESLAHLQSWYRDLQQHADPRCIICVAANKCDKPNAVDQKAVDEFVTTTGSKLFRTSALTGAGVTELFAELITHIAREYRDGTPPEGSKGGRSGETGLKIEDRRDESSTGCC